MALVIGGAHRRRARRAAAPDGDDGADRRRSRASGDDLMGRKILFVTTDQQRYDTLGCNGGTLARTPVVDALAAAGVPVRARPPAIGRVHAVALDDPHRPAPEHARRVDERRCRSRSTRRRSRRCSTRPATARRSSASRTSSRSSTRSPASPRTASPVGRSPPRSRVRRHHRAAPRLRALRVGDPRRRRVAALRALAGRRPIPRRSGCSTRCSTPCSRSTRSAAATPAHRRCTTTRSRASGTTPTGWPTARSPGSTRSPPTTTGSAG